MNIYYATVITTFKFYTNTPDIAHEFVLIAENNEEAKKIINEIYKEDEKRFTDWQKSSLRKIGDSTIGEPKGIVKCREYAVWKD